MLNYIQKEAKAKRTNSHNKMYIIKSFKTALFIYSLAICVNYYALYDHFILTSDIP
jgi:hypothetical protein